MMAIRKEWGEVPCYWSIYFAVADLDASLAKAGDLGATVVAPPIEVAGVGRIAPLQDPQGGHFSIIQIDPARMAGA